MDKTIGRKTLNILVSLMTVLMCVAFLSRAICADTGPKRSLDIKILNAPSEPYYIAILDDQDYYRDINDRVGCDRIPEGEEWVRETFYNYDEDGFRLYTYAGGYNSIFCSEFDIVDKDNIKYSYMVPSTFKVMVVTQSGEVTVSNAVTAKAFYADFEYDYAANTLKEVGSVFNIPNTQVEIYTPDYIGLAVESMIYLFVTVVTEGLVLLCFRLFTKKNLKPFIIINLLTQLLLFAFNLFCLIWEPMLRSHFQYWFIIEAVIMLIEVLWYRKRLTGKQGTVSQGRNIAYGITANLVSMFIDFPIMFFIVVILR